MKPARPPLGRPRSLRPVTADRLEKAAAAYVARYDASSARLRNVLMRRVLTARRRSTPIVADVETVIDGIVARYCRAGIIDDARYAERKAGSLHRRGVSTRHIREKLKLSGIEGDSAQRALEVARAEATLGDGDMDLHAAVAFARRRRLGPYRPGEDRRERRTKDLAALGRAGFNLDIARRVIDADDPEALLVPETSP